jgi:hypothetical protein
MVEGEAEEWKTFSVLLCSSRASVGAAEWMSGNR